MMRKLLLISILCVFSVNAMAFCFNNRTDRDLEAWLQTPNNKLHIKLGPQYNYCFMGYLEPGAKTYYTVDLRQSGYIFDDIKTFNFVGTTSSTIQFNQDEEGNITKFMK